MQSVTFANNPTAIIIALIVGTVPAVLWLFFWLREDKGGKREPTGLIVITFIAGMISVILVLPIQKFIAGIVTDHATQITLWAGAEEILKYAAFLVVMAKSPYLDEPVDYAIYLMTAALGFAALENAMYLIHPIGVNDATVSFLTGNLRFLGSTLLHSVTSGILGMAIGLAFFKDSGTRFLAMLIGLCAAIGVHSIFNFYIMQENGKNFMQIFGLLWVLTIIVLLVFEKLRRMSAYVEREVEKPIHVVHL